MRGFNERERRMDGIYAKTHGLYGLGFKDIACKVFARLAQEEHGDSLNMLGLLCQNQEISDYKLKPERLFRKALQAGVQLSAWKLAVLYKKHQQYDKSLYWLNHIIRSKKDLRFETKARIEKSKFLIEGIAVKRDLKKAHGILHAIYKNQKTFSSLSVEEGDNMDTIMRDIVCIFIFSDHLGHTEETMRRLTKDLCTDCCEFIYKNPMVDKFMCLPRSRPGGKA
jgi:hypothetical protein